MLKCFPVFCNCATYIKQKKTESPLLANLWRYMNVVYLNSVHRKRCSLFVIKLGDKFAHFDHSVYSTWWRIRKFEASLIWQFSMSENQFFDLNNISQLKDLKASYFIVSHMGMSGFVFCMLPQYRGQESQAIIFPPHP